MHSCTVDERNWEERRAFDRIVHEFCLPVHRSIRIGKYFIIGRLRDTGPRATLIDKLMGNERTQRPEPFKRSTVALSLSLSLWQETDFYFPIALLVVHTIARVLITRSLLYNGTGRGVQSSRFATLVARPFFPFPSSFSSPSGNGAFTDKRSLLAAGVALVERDEAVFGPPTLFSSDSFSLSLSLVTRNRSRLIVKKKRKKRKPGFGRYPPTTTLLFCTGSFVREK